MDASFFGLGVSQVSATGPMESCSGLSRRHELSGAGGRGEGAVPVPALQSMHPWETTKAFTDLDSSDSKMKSV